MYSNSHFEKNTNHKKSKNDPEDLDNKEKKRKLRPKSKRDLFEEVNDLYDPQNRKPMDTGR